MIQRIQTVLLFLAAILNVCFIFTPLYDRALEDPTAWISSGLFSALLLSSAVSLFSIFLYKNRPFQVRWVRRGMIFQVLGIGFATGIIFTLGGFGSFLLDEIISLALIVLVLILQYGAVHFISKDDKLVKSMDRIR